MSEQPKGFVTASHSVLFEDLESHRCDVCKDTLVKPAEEDDDEPYSGRGVFIWARGDERRYQESLLCPVCAAAIGVSAHQRWEIEEEEG
jgi:hypothetical protein